MAKLPRLSGKEVIKILIKQGFNVVRQRGSHVVLSKITVEKKITTIVPMHTEIDKGTLLEIIRKAQLTREDFLKLL